MGWHTLGLFVALGLGVVGWVLAFTYRRRAMRYRAAFDRAFAIARRAYNFSGDETNELTRLIGEPLEPRSGETDR
jgi:Flp pilus assembly protein TadB